MADHPKSERRAFPPKERGGQSGCPTVLMDDPEQSARFIEAARELGADGPEAAKAFDRAFDRIAPARPAGVPALTEPVPARVRAREPKRRRNPS